MIRTFSISLLLATVAMGSVQAQDTGTTRLRAAVPDNCRIESIAFARSGVGIVGTCGEGERLVLVTDGGSQPGGVSAFISWALAAKAGQTNARNTVTILHRDPSPTSQAICAELSAPGTTRRRDSICREIVSALD